MTYDNPLRPSGHEAYDIGTVIKHRTAGSGVRYEYVGTYSPQLSTIKHVLRDQGDGLLYETTNLEDYIEHVEPPVKGSTWRTQASHSTVTVHAVVDVDDGVGDSVVYSYSYDKEQQIPYRYIKSLAGFMEGFEVVK